ncbi:MAG: S46 family peptidase [Bacteroidales bacterium]
MKKTFLTLIVSFFIFIPFANADEGMWLVNLLDKQLYGQMKSKGLKLKANEIYNEEGGAISDAIIAIDGGSCSGSIISPEGLIITNHHCAYSDVHALSTSSKNYLEDGFWAMDRDQEVYIKGKTVTFLRKVLDVTDETNSIIDSLDKVGPRGIFFMRKVSSAIEKRYESMPYEKSLESMWRGSKYYLYFYEIYKDIRLVGAPPVSIGAFGGETDNWGWPQQKGDFAMYRVYASKDGKPAEYSKDNVPLAAKKYLSISAKGVKRDDFTMVLGYPGRTSRYMSSFELKEKYEILNPIVSGVRRAKLDVWKKYMDASPETRLKYSEKYFGVENYTDYAKWENICLGRYKVIDELVVVEKKLTEWINADPARIEKYGKVLENLKKGYELKADITKETEYFRESIVRGAEFTSQSQRLKSLARSLQRDKKDSLSIADKDVASFVNGVMKPLFASTDIAADRELFKVMLKYYVTEVPAKFYDKSFADLLASFKGDYIKLADYVYDNSIITDSVRMKNFFSKKRGVNEIFADPMIIIANTSGIVEYNRTEGKILTKADIDLSKERTLYVKALYEMEKSEGKAVYPDANSTMRLTYGEVGSIEPADGIYYHYQTATKGVLEKYNPKNYEFNLTPKMLSLLNAGDWGRWGENGKLYVDFLSDNDITGGNSGSAVMNAKGELIGLAFDGNRESMSGDVYFKEGYCKSVCVDIRYILWVIDKYANAQHLLNEMNIVK